MKLQVAAYDNRFFETFSFLSAQVRKINFFALALPKKNSDSWWSRRGSCRNTPLR